ncbi:MAG: peroxide stress protein YaaA [Bacteroidetes bacterium]|nr:peroxide stress protein YaaA [Bacteroidota bacterium]
MFILISPSKTLDFGGTAKTDFYTLPDFLAESETLVGELKRKSVKSLASMMNINPKLTQLNYERYQEWYVPFGSANAQEAVLTFKGEVYNGLKAESLSEKDLHFAQKKLRILSGLYGLLKPMDLIQPYRLEMGIKWKTRKWKNLYEFWGDQLTDALNKQMQDQHDKVLVNLSSNEYFEAIDAEKLSCRIITPVFKDFHNGVYKFMTAYGKKARGMMARYIIQQQIDEPDALKLFDDEGYYFNDTLSKGDNWVFTRG